MHRKSHAMSLLIQSRKQQRKSIILITYNRDSSKKSYVNLIVRSHARAVKVHTASPIYFYFTFHRIHGDKHFRCDEQRL